MSFAVGFAGHIATHYSKRYSYFVAKFRFIVLLSIFLTKLSVPYFYLAYFAFQPIPYTLMHIPLPYYILAQLLISVKTLFS